MSERRNGRAMVGKVGQGVGKGWAGVAKGEMRSVGRVEKGDREAHEVG